VAEIPVEEEEGEAREDMDVVVDRTTAIAHSQGASMSALDDTFYDAQSQSLVNESSDATHPSETCLIFLLAECLLGRHSWST